MVLQEAMLSLVGVAQLVESRIVIPVVAGSSPVAHPISFPVGPV
jgi:hypothetical protein